MFSNETLANLAEADPESNGEITASFAHLFDPYWTRHAAQAQGDPLAWPDQHASVARCRPRPA